MKKIFLFIAMFSTLHSFAQKDKKINLEKGQKITVVSTSNSDTDMGMGIKMESDYTNTYVLNVIAVDDKNYTISNTTTKMKIQMDIMGQSQSYDSEKPEDKDSDLGKDMSPTLNLPDTALVDKTSGAIVKNKKDSPERPVKGDAQDPFEGLMGGVMIRGFESNVVLEGAFFIFPKDKKVGDSWTDSSREKNITTLKTYTVKSIEKNIAVITIKGSVTGDGETEMQGSTVPFHMDTKTTGEMTVDIKNGLVNKNSNQADINATMELMGQTMTITSKGSYSVIYQY